jgi:hypothetical protein
VTLPLQVEHFLFLPRILDLVEPQRPREAPVRFTSGSRSMEHRPEQATGRIVMQMDEAS